MLANIASVASSAEAFGAVSDGGIRTLDGVARKRSRDQFLVDIGPASDHGELTYTLSGHVQ